MHYMTGETLIDIINVVIQDPLAFIIAGLIIVVIILTMTLYAAAARAAKTVADAMNRLSNSIDGQTRALDDTRRTVHNIETMVIAQGASSAANNEHLKQEFQKLGRALRIIYETQRKKERE